MPGVLCAPVAVTVQGQTELTIVPLASVDNIRLNCRQCIVTSVAINGDPVPFTTSDYTLAILDEKEMNTSDHVDFQDAFVDQQEQADNGEISIDPKQPLEPGGSDPTSVHVGAAPKHYTKEYTISVVFKIKSILGGLHFVLPQEGFHADRPRHMFTSAQIGEARLFMPCIDTFPINTEYKQEGDDLPPETLPPQHPTWELTYTVDAGMTAISAGELEQQVTKRDGRTVFQYQVASPTPSYLIGFAIGPFEALPDPKVPGVTHFCLPGLKTHLQHTIAVYQVVHEFAERTLDAEFPFESHQLVFVDETVAPISTYAGMSILSCSLLSSVKVIDKTLQEIRQTIARAVMLQYFSAWVLPNACIDVWLIVGTVQPTRLGAE